ncbi:hypothetical protein L9F63_015760, partial [Diploptera punctata]
HQRSASTTDHGRIFFDVDKKHIETSNQTKQEINSELVDICAPAEDFLHQTCPEFFENFSMASLYDSQNNTHVSNAFTRRSLLSFDYRDKLKYVLEFFSGTVAHDHILRSVIRACINRSSENLFIVVRNSQ